MNFNRRIRFDAGFTLVELLITIVIIGILVSMAYPSYVHYVQRSRHAEALAVLFQDQILMERCYAENSSYSATCDAKPAFPHRSPQNVYTINLSHLTTSTYTLTAIPIGTQASDSTCSIFSVNQAGIKTAFDSSLAEQSKCWNP